MSDYITLAAISAACILIIADMSITIWTYRKEKKDGKKK